ncbi:9967_t:CDS:2 [Gigaspora rosea]|nr:9967_t:CDS:2 [Gigaspora rosea]
MKKELRMLIKKPSNFTGKLLTWITLKEYLKVPSNIARKLQIWNMLKEQFMTDNYLKEEL